MTSRGWTKEHQRFVWGTATVAARRLWGSMGETPDALAGMVWLQVKEWPKHRLRGASWNVAKEVTRKALAEATGVGRYAHREYHPRIIRESDMGTDEQWSEPEAPPQPDLVEMRDQLETLMRELTPLERLIVTRTLDGCEQRQIAKETGYSPSSISLKYRRALRQMREAALEREVTYAEG